MSRLSNIMAVVSALGLLAPAGAQDTSGAAKGVSWEQGRTASWELAQHRKLSAALTALKPQRPGVVDAYVVVVGLDADPVFGREAAEAAKVLSRRYDALGHTILLASGSSTAPNGSPIAIDTVLAAVAAKMNLKEDVLILYTTSHGGPEMGVVYRDGTSGYGMIGPQRMADVLSELKIERRLIMISACYSGQFVTALASPASAIITAADDDRTSFGCALINTALRKPQPFEAAVTQAFELISTWEFAKGLTSSKPREFIGDGAKTWLAALEKRMPPGITAKVGRPAIEDEVVIKPH
jgi:Peptidase C13 family